MSVGIIQACEVCGCEAYSGNIVCRRCRVDRRAVVSFCEFRDCLRPAVELSSGLPLCGVHGARAERVMGEQVRGRSDGLNDYIWFNIMRSWGGILAA